MLYHRAQTWLRLPSSCIPLDSPTLDKEHALDLVKELSAIELRGDDGNRFFLELKKDLAKKIGHSSDLSDCFALSFYEALHLDEAQRNHAPDNLNEIQQSGYAPAAFDWYDREENGKESNVWSDSVLNDTFHDTENVPYDTSFGFR